MSFRTNFLRFSIICITICILSQTIQKNIDLYYQDLETILSSFFHCENVTEKTDQIPETTIGTNHSHIHFIHQYQKILPIFYLQKTNDVIHCSSNLASENLNIVFAGFSTTLIACIQAIICITISVVGFVAWVWYDLKRIHTTVQQTTTHLATKATM
jgi:hypothetical protein